jgi:2-polyprenyl-3-methyl-5-hydroxy-6-metoxy-1,4-benzoquinol methylase
VPGKNPPLLNNPDLPSLEKHTACLVCQSKNIQPLAGYYTEKGLVKCADCSFVFMERIPSIAELSDHYSAYAYEAEGYLSPITIKSYNLLLDEFEPYRKTGKLLDVGCGRGWFLNEAKKRGWEVYGTEYSDKAIELCQAEGINMKQGAIDSGKFDLASFDVITSFEVIEHINNPHEDLNHISKLLRTGGLFYCTTPNFNSLMRYYLKHEYNVIEYPEHLSYYTKSTLNKVAKMHQLKPVKFLTTGISVTRFKTSKKLSNETLIAEHSSDEVLRRNIESKGYLQLAKKLANGLLTATNTGLTLKGYYLKTS